MIQVLIAPDGNEVKTGNDDVYSVLKNNISKWC